MFCPGCTVPGPVFSTARSADAPPDTTVAAVLLLFSSLMSIGLETLAMFVKKVPGAVPAGMCRVKLNDTLLPAAKFGLVQANGPVPPAGIKSQLHPAGAVRLTKVIPVGNGSESDTLGASSGPTLPTFSV